MLPGMPNDPLLVIDLHQKSAWFRILNAPLVVYTVGNLLKSLNMKPTLYLALAAALCLATAARAEPSTASSPVMVTGCILPNSVEPLHKRINELENQLKELSALIGKQESALEGYLSSRENDQYAVIDTTELNNFGLAKTEYGNFPISIEDVTPYLDGYKLTISVANPTTMRFTGMEVDIRWGEGQKKEIRHPGEVRSGKWTTVPVVLAPVSADDLRKIFVRIGFNTIGF